MSADTYQWMVRAGIRTMGTLSAVLGIAMILGGPEHFSAPGFAAARRMPGGVYTWGGTIALAGVLVLAAILLGWRRKLGVAALRAAGLWYIFFVISLGYTALTTDAGAFTGPVAYSGLSTFCWIFAAGGLELETLSAEADRARADRPGPRAESIGS